MNQNPHIFIVDDEAPAREMVGDYLKMHGFGVTLCDGGKSLRKEIESSTPDLVVLDLNMPEEDGLSIIRDLKSKINVPVIMLTATASPIDRVVGLEIGADDYVAKPCELRELMARIRSVLRRSGPAKSAAPEPASAKAEKEQLVRFGTKWLDLEAQALRDDEGNEHPLTASEFGLLKVFAANPKRVLSRERLLELANARDAEAFDRAVDLRIMRIRRKIEFDPTKPSVIRTIRGGGYLFSGQGSSSPPFLDQAGGLWARGALNGKVGGAFTSSATQHGGQETTLFSIITNLLHFGMTVVGLNYGFAGQMKLDEVTGGAPYGATTITGGDGSRQPSENELAGARYQGRAIAEAARKLHG